MAETETTGGRWSKPDELPRLPPSFAFVDVFHNRSFSYGKLQRAFSVSVLRFTKIIAAYGENNWMCTVLFMCDV